LLLQRLRMLLAESYGVVQHGEFFLPDMRFELGGHLDPCRIAWTTLGDPGGEPVLLLHGTNGSANDFLTDSFGGVLFGPGQALDCQRYFLIMPDAIGSGASSKPSNGLKATFPRYTYLDMVRAQYRLVTECFEVSHLRLVLGNSMGGMHTWLWAQHYPGFMDIAVPMACQPTEIAGRNWMLRALAIDAIRRDPAWLEGNYLEQPESARLAAVFYGVASNGGDQALFQQAPNRQAADAMTRARLQAPFRIDANDFLFQMEAGAYYQPEAKLRDIRARVLAINSEDDERNPPSLGLLEPVIAALPCARSFWIASGPHTLGHATVGLAKLWQHELAREMHDS
jgi:homoserine O-acetyltransferase/O-succinyltransferase